MSNDQIQALLMKPVSVYATFNGKPSESARKRMVAAGGEYKNGRWTRTLNLENSGNVTGKIVSEEDAVKAFEDLAAVAKRMAQV